MVIVHNTKPVCKSVIPHSSVAENQVVNFTCSMTYAWLSSTRKSNVIPSVNVSFGWEGTSTAPLTKTLSQQQSVESEEATMTVDGAKKPQIPAQICTIRFTFAPTDTFVPRHRFAVNSVTYSCQTDPIPVRHCPTTVTVSPSSGQYKAGDVLTCKSDGYPEPSYTWSDVDGTVVSTGPNITLTNSSSFVLNCTATGNIKDTCSASLIVSGPGDPIPVSTVPTSAVMMTTVMMTSEMPGNETTKTGGGGGIATTTVIGIAVGVGALLLAACLIAWLVRRGPKTKITRKEEGRPQKSAAVSSAVRAHPPSRFTDNRPWMMDAYRRRFNDNYNYGQYSDCGKCYTPSSYVHKNVYVKNCDIGNRCVPIHTDQGVYNLDHEYGVGICNAASYRPRPTQKSVPMSPVFF